MRRIYLTARHNRTGEEHRLLDGLLVPDNERPDFEQRFFNALHEPQFDVFHWTTVSSDNGTAVRHVIRLKDYSTFNMVDQDYDQILALQKARDEADRQRYRYSPGDEHDHVG